MKGTIPLSAPAPKTSQVSNTKTPRRHADGEGGIFNVVFSITWAGVVLLAGALVLLAFHSPWALRLTARAPPPAAPLSTLAGDGEAAPATPAALHPAQQAANGTPKSSVSRRVLARPIPGFFQPALLYADRARQHHLSYLLTLFHQAASSGGIPPVDEARHVLRHALGRFNKRTGVFHPPDVWSGGSAYARFDAFMLQAMAMLSHQGFDRMLACPRDSTLPPPPNATRFAVAVNLHNSAPIMPSFTLQLLKLLLEMPAGNAYVLMYESGSTDETQLWLHVLQMLLEPIGVPHNITAGGDLTRQAGTERISYLAGVRNALIAPFYDDDTGCAAVPQHNSTVSNDSAFADVMAGGTLEAAAAATTSPGAEPVTVLAGEPARAACFKPQQFLFINDVYFCADDAIRLMQHDADMSCGLDMGMLGGGLRRRAAVRKLAAATGGGSSSTWDAPVEDVEQLLSLEGALPVAGHGSQLGRPARLLQAADEKFLSLVTEAGEDGSKKANFDVWKTYFYDSWVARDIDGQRFHFEEPYFNSNTSKERAMAGLPTPVTCCWNGMAVMGAEVFARGIRFRTHVDGECMASECSLLCDDMHRLGLSRILVDPTVRVTYGYTQKWLLQSPYFNYTGMTGLKITTWAEAAAAPPVNWTDEGSRANYSAVTCCDMLPEHDLIADWGKQCHDVDIMQDNHTHTYLETCLHAIQHGVPEGDEVPQYVVRKQKMDGDTVHLVRADCPARSTPSTRQV